MASFTFDRLPAHLRSDPAFQPAASVAQPDALAANAFYEGDARSMLGRIAQDSVALSVWSPPYFVGKSYEADWAYEDWEALLRDVIAAHQPIIAPGGFLAINIADILCFEDEAMPRVSAETLSAQRSDITRELVLATMREHPEANRHQLAALLGCSEQTIDRRLNGNNARGGKHGTQTRVKIVGGLVEEWALDARFYPYDRRVWVKDPCWANSRWTSVSYRAVDEFEYVYIFWKPGITQVDRSRLSADEWTEWGSRAVWQFPSVAQNDAHEAMFPVELPHRLIRLLTEPGDLVLDCFVGSGTTALAAARLDRRFIGIDSDPAAIATARSRLHDGGFQQHFDVS